MTEKKQYQFWPPAKLVAPHRPHVSAVHNLAPCRQQRLLRHPQHTVPDRLPGICSPLQKRGRCLNNNLFPKTMRAPRWVGVARGVEQNRGVGRTRAPACESQSACLNVCPLLPPPDQRRRGDNKPIFITPSLFLLLNVAWQYFVTRVGLIE